MSAVRGGHYCHSCQTRVVDLTELSEAEILELRQRGPVCGEISPRRARPAALAILAATVAACTPWGEDGLDPTDPESCPVVKSDDGMAHARVAREPGPADCEEITIEGRVTDLAGHPLEEAFVQVFRQGETRGLELLTNAKGRFRAEGLPAGTYLIAAQHRHGFAEQILAIEPGERVFLTFELFPENEFVRGGLG